MSHQSPRYNSKYYWFWVNSKPCPKCGAKKNERCRDARMTFPKDILHLHHERLGGKAQ